MPDWIVEPLDSSHDRTAFSAGERSLDDFLKNLVSQYERRRLGRTYLIVRSGEKRVLGYYTLASGSLAFDNLPVTSRKKLPRHPIPVILLARLAVDETVRGHGLGRRLLVDALGRCLDLADRLGVHAVSVDALDDSARSFYTKYGFIALQDRPLVLFLPMATIQEALRPRT